jgi:hypothetical protein
MTASSERRNARCTKSTILNKPITQSVILTTYEKINSAESYPCDWKPDHSVRDCTNSNEHVAQPQFRAHRNVERSEFTRSDCFAKCVTHGITNPPRHEKGIISSEASLSTTSRQSIDGDKGEGRGKIERYDRITLTACERKRQSKPEGFSYSYPRRIAVARST